ncbi:MAG: TolC family protein [Sulfurovum sp.]
MKNLLIICSLLVTSVYSDNLSSILSTNKELLFDYSLESNELESDKLSNSWMSPIQLSYSKNYTTQFGSDVIIKANYTVSINQPIFRSGGIYYGIKYAESFRNANRTDIKLQKRMMIADAVSILFSMKKAKLEQKKLRFLIKNDKIDIRQKRDSYQSGLLDSSFLDQAILKKSQDQTALLQIELTLLELHQKFKLLSDKNPKKLKLPKLKLMSRDNYKTKNLELKRDIFKAEQASNNVKITWAKYLPAVYLSGQYTKGDPQFTSMQGDYYSYGLTVSMPIDFNSYKDIESSKVAKLKSELSVLDKKDSIDKEYQWIKDSLRIINKKINLAHKDEKIYKNLYRVTKNLVKAGEKTKLDSDIMYNSLQIRKIDQKIFRIDKQVQLLKLYARMENAL